MDVKMAPPIDLILLTLLPSLPTRSASDFTKDLQDVSITAFGLTTGNNVTGVKLGIAAGLPKSVDAELAIKKPTDTTLTDPTSKLETSILQNYTEKALTTMAVATAVIVVDIQPAKAGDPLVVPAPYLQDIRIEIQRNGKTICNPVFEYNVTVKTVTYLSKNTADYMSPNISPSVERSKEYENVPVSAYVFIPPAPPQGATPLPFIPVNPKAQFPAFGDILSGINAVLAIENPSDGSSQAQQMSTTLSTAQCSQIASVLTWNRTSFPVPQYPPSSKDTTANNAGQQFEASLASYNATLAGQASKLAGFVYAASAAIYAEKKTTRPVTTTVVPAAYFYVLGALQLDQVSADARYTAAVSSTVDTLLSAFKKAVATGVLNNTETTVTLPDGVTLDLDAAAQRIASLGTAIIKSTSTPKPVSNISVSKTIAELPAAEAPDSGTSTSTTPPTDYVPVFRTLEHDAIGHFLAEYSGNFDFSAKLDSKAIEAIETTVATAFPKDKKLQTWTKKAIETISTLFQLSTVDSIDKELQFSLMESLYARGFTSAEQVVILTQNQFSAALEGTVAYHPDYANGIHKNATNMVPSIPKPGPEPKVGFAPVNPGNLVDSIPPANLSPFGSVEYLHEMLQVAIGSTTLGAIIEKRRGPLGDLKASMANLETVLPSIDIVNESLEALAMNLSSHCGVVYQTNTKSLDGFKFGTDRSEYDPETLFAAIPEHSSPAMPSVSPSIYKTLKNDFTAPTLPYAQELDISRTYLSHLDTSRYETMRRFRKDITEFVLDPSNEPNEFQAYLWRYPVKLDIAIEYLHISREELANLYTTTIDDSALAKIFGFTEDVTNWTQLVSVVPTFLERTGLTYCEFIDLWQCGYVAFSSAGKSNKFPLCQPSCMTSLTIKFVEESLPALRKVAVFVRLWQCLKRRYGEVTISFLLLSDICTFLHLFNGNVVNADFIRQLISFFMLRDEFNLSFSHNPELRKDIPVRPEERTKLLSLWVKPHITSDAWTCAVESLLDHISEFARRKYSCPIRPTEYKKVVLANINSLSLLSGFTDTDNWYSTPTCTLRFSEILAKIYASDYDVGEIIYLFKVNQDFIGHHPFPLPAPLESVNDPLHLPEEHHDVLWQLRHLLLNVKVEDKELREWTWCHIENTIRTEFGFICPPGKPDPLIWLGQHFFPSALEAHGHHVPGHKRQFCVPLPADETTPLMWDYPRNGPFHYHSGKLCIELPLRDDALLEKLLQIRQLNDAEQVAVRDLYFAPRVALAPFALFFTNFSHAADHMIHEPEPERFAFFQRQFAIFHRRCTIIAEHLAEHVNRVTGTTDHNRPLCDVTVAWHILKTLIADENISHVPWEKDSGKPPAAKDFTWDPHLSGSAFAALLGLVGTGLLGECQIDKKIRWHEVRGPLSGFGHVPDEKNTPLPTVLPSLGVTPTTDQRKLVVFHNGFAIQNSTAEPLGGAEPFCITWTGSLLIEHPGSYSFSIPSHHEHHHDDTHWLVTLQLGQKKWTILNHNWETDEPECGSDLPYLHRGGYQIVVQFRQTSPSFVECEIHPAHTGFELKYCGPDTEQQLVVIPFDKLFLESKSRPLSQGVDTTGVAESYLKTLYVSSLRDIRRTYQRAFKAILFSHRFHLSAKPTKYRHGMSELWCLLDHPANFLGTDYYQPTNDPSTGSTGAVVCKPHHAYFDFNFLPIKDPYMPPTVVDDDRAYPSHKREAAMFDWWERIFDYCHLRDDVNQSVKDPQEPLWIIFLKGDVQEPDVVGLVRHLGVDSKLAPLVLMYFTGYSVTMDDLSDERWSTRVWNSRQWLQKLQKAFFSSSMPTARPDLWASNDPNLIVDATTKPPLSGNENLTHFFQKSCLVDSTIRRFDDIKKVNDELRLRARSALLTYLCAMNRVSTGKTFVKVPRELSDLLLQDVETDLSECSSRIEDAINAVQIFVQRARVGLESSLKITHGFTQLWDSCFATYEGWRAYRRRLLYNENWIHWDDLQVAGKSEGFQFFESELKQNSLTIPRSMPSMVWQKDTHLPERPSLHPIQRREFAALQVQSHADDQGVPLIGTPERAARPAWIAPVVVPNIKIPNTTSNISAEDDSADANQIPLWFQAAVRLGTRFIRVAAAGIPPGTPYSDRSILDEYYFWLTEGKRYDPADAKKDADTGSTGKDPKIDPTSDWDDSTKLPELLHWPSRKLVHLSWTRVHQGVFDPPRRSDEGVSLMEGDVPDLKFKGRRSDSLTFTVVASTKSGFRYDLAADSVVLIPQVIQDTFPKENFPPPLTSYPYFVYFTPGAPLQPISSFCTALTIAATLRIHCKFEAALDWCREAFDPLKRTNTWAQCPEKNSADKESHDHVPPDEIPDRDLPCRPTGLVQSGISRGRAVLLEYVEILIQWGESLKSRYADEASQQALVLFNEVDRILGPQPIRVYSQDEEIGATLTVADFQASPASLNPRLMMLYERVAYDRNLVHQYLDTRRSRNQRKFYGERKSQLQHHAIARDDMSVCREIGIGCLSCCPPYRFSSLLPKALDYVSLVRSLGSSLLGAYEKGDAEFLAALRVTQNRQIVDLDLQVREYQYREADWQVQALGKTMEDAQHRLKYYNDLITAGLNAKENGYVSQLGDSKTDRNSANDSEQTAKTEEMDPDSWIGDAGISGPVELEQLPVGTKLAGTSKTAARILRTNANIAITDGELQLTQGEWERREAWWKHRVDIIQIEIERIKRQTLAADRRRDITFRDLNNHQQQIEHCAEVQNFMRDKLTKHELFLFLQQETAALYRQAYNLAFETARDTQQALHYERADVFTNFLPADAWDNLHDGLLAGEQLEVALRALERTYMGTNCREYEITKNISLRTHFPIAFLYLKKIGACDIEIPEWMFDLDYPGHYLRRIKSVSITIPCTMGPYVGVHCHLQLLSSKIRLNSCLPGPKACCCRLDKHHAEENNRYESDSNTIERFTATESIATSSGENDAGLFKLDFHDERYLPFELSGAVSRWHIEMPRENNQFDLDTVRDFVIHLNYTSREGSPTLRREANERAQRHLPGEGIRLFDLRHDFPQNWAHFAASTEDITRDYHDLRLQLNRGMFPFLTGSRTIRIARIQLFIETIKRVNVGQHVNVRFDPYETYCRDGKKEFVCIVAADMSRLYDGMLDIDLGPIAGDLNHDLGIFHFPRSLNKICQVYMLCHYSVQEE